MIPVVLSPDLLYLIMMILSKWKEQDEDWNQMWNGWGATRAEIYKSFAFVSIWAW